jgi:hypothetical protein
LAKLLLNLKFWLYSELGPVVGRPLGLLLVVMVPHVPPAVA